MLHQLALWGQCRWAQLALRRNWQRPWAQWARSALQPQSLHQLAQSAQWLRLYPWAQWAQSAQRL